MDYIRKVSNADLLADARGYRKGIKYFGGRAERMRVENEIKRRQKLGLIKKSAIGTKRKSIRRNGFGLSVPRF